MTAYDVRISDWSSDVCSSDLLRRIGTLDRRIIFVEEILDAHLAAVDRCAEQRADAGGAILGGNQEGPVRRGGHEGNLGGEVGDLQVDILHRFAGALNHREIAEIGRASCRERVCQYV